MYSNKHFFKELLKKSNYDDSIVSLVKSKIFPEEDDIERQYFTNLINKINYIDDDAYSEFEKDIINILKKTNNYDKSKNIVDLMSKVANKNITFHNNHLKAMEIDYKPTFTISKNGLSDAYHLYKIREIIEKNKPEFDNFSIIADEMEKYYKSDKKITLKEHDEILKKVYDKWNKFDS